MSRVGIALGALESRPFADLVDAAVAADRAGFELIAVPEAWGREAFSLLGYLAARTSGSRLATGIVNVYSRSPALIAMGAATLDELSGGRAALGLGVSGARVVEGFHGEPMRRPLRRLREVTEAVRALLRRDRDGYAGELVRIEPGFVLRSVRGSESVPIYHASLTPAGIRQCAEVADGWFPFLHSVDALARDMSLVRDALERTARPRAAFTVAPFVPTIVDADLDVARGAIKKHLAFYLGAMGRFYHETLTRHGFGPVVQASRAEWQAGRRDAAARAISDDMVDAISACGSADRVRSRLDEFRAAGADLPLAFLPMGSTLDQARRTITAIA
ncbi:MAG TPA: LLM class flavin-dependent oxidoreductase [Candidatus Limnocylindria bacterium]|nr:LLM class flavin-dependent oxidoreductase [Candidatus Limnocylindria bacterium]